MIKNKLDAYLQFDSSELFKGDNYIRIFGGAIRDIIADQPINDVDILVLPTTKDRINWFLLKDGYKRIDHTKPETTEQYKNSIISEPWTYIKNDAIIQLITPRYLDKKFNVNIKKNINTVFFDLINNVDLSCCGVSYDGEYIYENVNSAISHCYNKVYEINKNALLYNESRCISRQHKLNTRGWKNIHSTEHISYKPCSEIALPNLSYDVPNIDNIIYEWKEQEWKQLV